MTYTPVIFKKKKATVRYADGKMDMITFYVPFGELPIGAKFRFGYQQDDYVFEKVNNTTGTNNWDYTFTKVTPKNNTRVLIDFMLTTN